MEINKIKEINLVQETDISENKIGLPVGRVIGPTLFSIKFLVTVSGCTDFLLYKKLNRSCFPQYYLHWMDLFPHNNLTSTYVVLVRVL